ncbi:MAG: hypothetical protein ACRERD_26890, partial [Candidatus Binatia bacterium]
MRRTMKAMVSAACLVVGVAAAASAAGQRDDGGFVSGPGSVDAYVLVSSEVGKICAEVEDTGPNFDNIFGAAVL